MKNHKKVLAFAFSLISDLHMAEDLVQEAFIVAFKKIDNYDSTRDLGKWVRGIVRMKYLEQMRKRCDVAVGDDIIDLIDLQFQYWEKIESENRKSLSQFLNECMQKLGDIQKEIVNMFYFQRQKSWEIAANLELNEMTVRKRLERIRLTLKECLDSKSAET